MSLRKTAYLTSRRVDAQRHNAGRSTGPRSEAGKERVKLNALKHGCDAAAENEADVMRALGEDPARFAALKRELATAYGPGDALWDRQMDDLARLYWRRQRIERMETGMMREALAGVEERRRGFARALADLSFEPSQCEAVALELPKPVNALLRLRMLISLWGVIRDQARRRVFTLAQRNLIENYYQAELGWRPRQIGHLLLLLQNRAYLGEKQDPARLDKYVKETFGDEAGAEARYQELLGLLEEQIAATEAAFADELQAQQERDAMTRDSCLAPEDETANMVLRLGMGLDRAIDRKVRILLSLRKEQARQRRDESRMARTCRSSAGRRHPTEPEAGPPGNDPEVAPTFGSADADPSLRSGQAPKVNATAARRETQTPKGRGLPQPASSICDSGQGSEAPPSLRETQTPKGRGLRQPACDSGRDGQTRPSLRETQTPKGRGLRQPASATQTESPADESAPETPKSPEQSQNVIENKGSAVDGVRS